MQLCGRLESAAAAWGQVEGVIMMIRSAIIAAAVVGCAAPVFGADANAGHDAFQQQCALCHSAQPGDHGTDSVLGSLDSGYVRRGNQHMPRQGTKAPWIVLNNYVKDFHALRRARFDDGLLQFSRPRPTLVKDSVKDTDAARPAATS